MTVIAYDTSVAEVLRTLPPVDTRYYTYLLGNAPADGALWDHAETAAQAIGCHPVTVSKSRARLEDARLILRTGGGFVGTAVTMVVFRSLRDGFARMKERALAAIAATRRARAQAGRARKAGLRKASQTASPSIPSRDGDRAGTPPRERSRHPFTPNPDFEDWCRCGVPRGNGIHR